MKPESGTRAADCCARSTAPQALRIIRAAACAMRVYCLAPLPGCRSAKPKALLHRALTFEHRHSGVLQHRRTHLRATLRLDAGRERRAPWWKHAHGSQQSLQQFTSCSSEIIQASRYEMMAVRTTRILRRLKAVLRQHCCVLTWPR